MPLCSLCKKIESREGQWTCNPCHNEYQRAFRVRSHKQIVSRAYTRGFEAFRAAAVQRFTELKGTSQFNGLVAAEIIRQIPTV